MKQLSQLIEDERNAGQIYYACSIRKPIQPTLIRLVSYTEILKEEAFNNKQQNLLAVCVNDTCAIPNPNKFNTIPTSNASGVVVFNTYDECYKHFSTYWKAP